MNTAELEKLRARCLELETENNRLVTLLASREGLTTRTAMGRIIHVLEILRGGNHPNATGIARVMGVTTKTIQRDIQFIKRVLGIKLKFNQLENGFEIIGTMPFDWFTIQGAKKSKEDFSLLALLKTHRKANYE